MVQKIAVYRKSALGAEALARRDAALSMRLRSLLILVDGKRNADELARLAAAPAEVQQQFAQLLELGMIEPLTPASATGATATATATTATTVAEGVGRAGPASSSPPVPARIVTLAEAQRAAVRGLTNLLGPTADDLCMRIESARTAQDLLVVIKRAEIAVRAARGAQAAAAFMADMQAHQPG